MSNRKRHYTNKMSWFKFYTADWVAATHKLSAAERGIYTDLIRLVWENGLLPNDPDKLRLMMLPVGHTKYYKKVPVILEQFFKQLDNDRRWYFPGFGDHHQQFLT